MSPDRKICNLQQLLDARQAARAAGKTVVHCHGCFDIVHPGHISYLQFAATQGDILIVTVSADPQVNKGINRPLIPEDLRAASLAALECVDYVYINPHPTAVELLEQLQPDIYIKGREYEINHDPRFLAERDTVIRHGGRVVFSSGEVVYSSTALINALEDSHPLNQEKVRRFREDYDLTSQHLLGIVNRFHGRRAVVIGDYILDRYHLCDATGVAAEAPMMSLRTLRSDDYDGGAAIIAAHLAGLGATPTLVTAFANDEASRQVADRLSRMGIEVQATNHRRQLVTKHRFLVDEQKLFKVDEGPVQPLDSAAEATLADRILAAAEGADVVIFADFGYGLMTGGLLDRIMPPLRQRVPVLTADVSGVRSSLLRFKHVDLLTPTEREMRQALGDHSSGLTAVVYNMLQATRCPQALITLGKQGLVAFDHVVPMSVDGAWERRLRSAYLPSLAGRVVDPLGCGDALLAVASMTLAVEGSLQAAAYLGSLAAAVAADRLGNHPVTADQLLNRIPPQPLAASMPQRLAS